MVITPKLATRSPDAAKGSVFTAARRYLIQSDVLAVLGNILTTRDDTFTIRAYGEVTSRGRSGAFPCVVRGGGAAWDQLCGPGEQSGDGGDD